MKKKIMMISDDIRAFSGVGTMARYIVDGTKDLFDWITIGSLATHPEKGKIVDFEGTKIYAAEGFGSIELIRAMIESEKPEALVLFTDPRFFGHVFAHEDEIRSRIPIVYLNIWDGGPPPLWNVGPYNSVDHLAAISRQTYAMNAHVAPGVAQSYVPHGTDLEVYHPLPENEVRSWFKEKAGFLPKFSVLYCNRNIRRKNPGDLVLAVHRLIEKTRDFDITLLLRTEAVDGDGTDIPAVLEGIGYRGRVIFFGSLDTKEMNLLYNFADVTVNMASNEGFGITSIESLAAGTPTIVNMTGGLQDQVGLLHDDESPVTLDDYTSAWYTNADGRFKKHRTHSDIVFPKVRTLNGSPATPYVLQEYANTEDVTEKLLKVYGETREYRKYRGLKGREYLIAQGMTRQIMAQRMASAIMETIDNFIPRSRFEVVNVASNPFRVEGGVITETHKEVTV